MQPWVIVAEERGQIITRETIGHAAAYMGYMKAAGSK